MSCNLRSSSIMDDVVCGLDLRSRETCTFSTFGKLSTTTRSAVMPPLSAVGVIRSVQPTTAMSNSATIDLGVCGTGSGRERKSSTETGPPDPSALRPGLGGESTSNGRCRSPDVDDDDVFPVADVGCSSIASIRSVSVPPRRTRSCAQPFTTSEVSSALNAATTIKISPPRMKRRKKKSAAESESVSCKASSSVPSADNPVLPLFARRSNKVAEVTKLSTKNVTGNNGDSNSGDDDRLPVEQPSSSASRENSSANTESETKRKKNIRWKTEVAQSSPDVASDDADSKESGYITLEDLQAQLGLSSWSSDERQTDQDVLSSSGDELRAPDGLGGVQSTSSTSSAFEAPSAAVCRMPPSSSSFLLPLMPPPEQFDALRGGIDCCHSAPPIYDASLLKFTFTIRLDSKMFHRRAAHKAGRRNPAMMMVTDVQKRGWCTATDRDKEPALAPAGGITEDQTARPMVDSVSSQDVENQSSEQACGSGHEPQNVHISSSAAASTAVSTPQPDCAVPCANINAQQQQQQFDGEKVIVTAEVHRSADQLDTDPPKSSNTVDVPSNNSHRLNATKSSAAVPVCKKELTRRTADHNRSLSMPCQPDDTIVTCSADGEFLDRQCFSSVHRDQIVAGGFNGRLNYVDVDRVMSRAAKRQTIDRQQSSTSAVSQRSTRKISDGLTLTLRKPLKLRNPERSATTGVVTLPRKRSIEVNTGRSQRRTDESGSSKVRSSTAAESGRRTATDRHFSCDRTAGRMFCESSSDSEPDICGQCLARDTSLTTTTMTCGRSCSSRCSRYGGKMAGIITTVAGGRLSNATTEGSAASRSKSTRRAFRHFFRVENLFACRHGRPSSDKYPSMDNEDQGIGCREDAGRRGVSATGAESTSCRGGGRCGRSSVQSTLQCEPAARTCRRSRVSRSSRRTADLAVGGAGAAATASRSVSPPARHRSTRCSSRAAANDVRKMSTTSGTCSGGVTSRDRSSTVDRCCRHAWPGTVDRAEESSTTPAGDWNGGGERRWATLCVSPSDNGLLTPESGCGFSNRRRVMATTPISPATPAPDNLHAATLGQLLFYLYFIYCLSSHQPLSTFRFSFFYFYWFYLLCRCDRLR